MQKKYKVEYKAKTPHGIAQETVNALTTFEVKRVGEFLTDALAEYGKIDNISIDYVRCPVCDACPECGSK